MTKTGFLNSLQPLDSGLVNKSSGPATGKVDQANAGEFLQTLQKSTTPKDAQLNASNEAISRLKFSSHAIERMRSRGISFDPEQLKKLEEAVNKAEKKGARDTLVLTDNAAFVVSVKNKTVVTALDKGFMRENVFTNIDSTILI